MPEQTLPNTSSQSLLALDTWLPIVGGIAAGIGAAALMAGENWILFVPIILALPAILLFIRYPFVAVMVWMLVFPFVVEMGSGNPRYIYWLVHRALIPGAFLFLFLKRVFSRQRRSLPFGLPDLFVLLFFLYVVTNAFLFSKPRIPSFVHIYDRLFVPFCMYAILRLLAPGRADMLRLAPVAFVSLLIQCGISFLSWFRPAVLPAYWLTNPGRTDGTLGATAIYTGMLMVLILLILQVAIESRKWWLRSILFSSVFLGFFAVFFSFSRGSWVGGLLVLIGLLRLYPSKTLRAVLIVAGVMVLAGSLFLREEMSWATQRLENEKTAGGRIINFVAGANLAMARPVFGWGYDNYNLHVARYTQNVGSIQFEKIHSSHNSTMTILAELGLVGLVLSALPVLHWLRRSLRIRRLMPQQGFEGWPFLVMLWLCVLNLFAVSCFSDIVSAANPTGMVFFWMALGLIASLVDPYYERGQLRTQPS